MVNFGELRRRKMPEPTYEELMLPTVHNHRHSWWDFDGRDAVNIDRRTKWGNPYRVTKNRTRERAIELYRGYLKQHPELVEAAQRELKGKRLICWCNPLPCHGDVLVRVANGLDW